MQPQLQERQHLLGARHDGELLGGHRVDPRRVQHGQQVALDVGPRLLEAQLGVDLLDPQPLADLGRLARAAARRRAASASASEWAASVESTSVRWPAGGGERRRTGGQVDLPTPPLPVKRRTRTSARASHQASDSTRCLSPFSAVSMRIFSPLRLIIPISGMDTSRASR